MSDTAAAGLVESLLASIPDFPEPGILFRDLTPVFADPTAFRAVIDELVAPFAGHFDAIAGIDARGFLLAGAAAYRSQVGVLAIRKRGKLPGVVLTETYELEYGTAALELHPEQLSTGSRVLILDDVLATGGTVAAGARLVERAGYRVAGVATVLELLDLGGRARLDGRRVHVVLGV
ncbi:MAG: adenine phosphoribosyltransferase [Microbacteriaceae bacterium]